MNTLRPDLPTLPARMRHLPINEAGYPVPHFVAWIEGKPEFRCIRPEVLTVAIARRLCWICGQRLTSLSAFVLGPMCSVNRVNAEPPSHVDCARFAARACPFLTRPKATRREDDLPDDAQEMAGCPIKRNPGCCAVWATRQWKWEYTSHGHRGQLCMIGDPEWVEWYAEGRVATREEVMASIDSGLPILMDMAEKEGRQAVRELRSMHVEALKLLPVGAA